MYVMPHPAPAAPYSTSRPLFYKPPPVLQVAAYSTSRRLFYLPAMQPSCLHGMPQQPPQRASPLRPRVSVVVWCLCCMRMLA